MMRVMGPIEVHTEVKVQAGLKVWGLLNVKLTLLVKLFEIEVIIQSTEVAAEIHDYYFVHEVEVNVKVAIEAKHMCGV